MEKERNQGNKRKKVKSVKLPVVLLTQQMSYNDHPSVSGGKELINEVDLSQNELIFLMKLNFAHFQPYLLLRNCCQ